MISLTKKSILLIYVFVLLIQVFFLLFFNTNQNIGYESNKALEEYKIENPGVVEKIKESNNENTKDEILLEVAKKIFIEKSKRPFKDKKSREYVYSLNEDEKRSLLNELNLEIEKLKRESPESYKIIELKYEISIIRKGYNLINFFMEKILKFDSYEFLKNQTNYFFLILSTIIFLIIIGLKIK
jgi:hypothetical protein